MINVGDVFALKDGSGLKIEEFDPHGKFIAQVRSMTTGEWTSYRIEGDAEKLGPFLHRMEAVKVFDHAHP